jgi:predicted kinase
VSKLVLINGAPGSGKSTLARRYVEEHPLTLALDIDQVRGMLGRWLDTPTEAGRAARDLALAMARVHLAGGRDVVVPQYLGRPEFILELETLAQQAKARFVEIALRSDPDEVVSRFARRAANPQNPEQRDAAILLERSGGLEALPAMYERLISVVAARPATRVIVTIDGEIELTYQRMLAQINAA